ncbi:type II toxin-antitoxin system PemK/MazF family toxin [Cellulomonas gilvus]|uniref:type II toxin-antitoxin system PemK/MazF family toxin n=1 Tax=Cellulomonas gilvus TaxID=11 RepID=UPI0002E50D8E|nr:type II toxin-antitoxin system PemK/MazF family toxin [Cellulomonas gilvus]
MTSTTSLWSLLRQVRDAVRPPRSGRPPAGRGRTRGTPPAGAPPHVPSSPGAGRAVLPDHVGPVGIGYAPEADGAADPGEIVWTWVPFEEDASRGKDRPVLVVGWDGPVALGLMLTSKDHTRDAAREARYGRVWLDLGAGDWDAQGRESEVRLDRVLRLDPTTVRREGAVLDRARFDLVTSALMQLRTP